METKKRARKVEQKVHEIKNKILLMDLVISTLLSLNWKLRENLASVCRAIDSISSTIRQRNPRSSNTVIFNGNDHIPFYAFKNTVSCECSMIGHHGQRLELRKPVLSRSSLVLLQFLPPAAAMQL